jgi:hypothetical protein
VRPAGSILTKQGYDPGTGLLLRSEINWKSPVLLTRDTAKAAAQRLIEPFSEFPFTPDSADSDSAPFTKYVSRAIGQAVVISAILTGLQRRMLRTAPAHAFDANLQGSGKTLLADCISIIVTGGEVPAVSAGDGDEKELAKLFTSILIAGDAVVLIDNIVRPLESPTFALLLTRTLFQGRILGLSKTAKVPTNCLFLLTGNNLEFLKDMPRRVLVARIEVEEEHPDMRAGFKIANLKQYCLDNREALVGDALTIVAAYANAGRPCQHLTPYGSFEQWSDEIRSAMVWAGLKDPCATRAQITANDPERESTLRLFEQWFERFGDRPIHTQDLINEADIPVMTDGKFEGWFNADLRAALLDVAWTKGRPLEIDARRLGWWCRNHRDRSLKSDTYRYQLKKRKADRVGSTWQIVAEPQPATTDPA